MKYFKTQFKNVNIRGNSGFTLVEVLVAVSVFSFAVLSMMVILGDGLANINYAKRKVTATYLAQEGIEYMRNLRDTFVLFEEDGTTPGWVQFLDYTSPCFPNPNSNSKFCFFNPEPLNFNDSTKPITDMIITACPGSNCPQLYYDADTLKYNYDIVEGNPSGFIRGIRMSQEKLGPDEVLLESYVFWAQGSGIYEVSMQEYLFNWTKQQ